MEVRSTMRRIVALVSSLVLIPEALLFLGLAVWRGIRFAESVREPGPPLWYSCSSAIFLLTASWFCFATCRDLWRKVDSARTKTGEGQLSRGAGTTRGLSRVTTLWLTAAFTMCMLVLPLLLVTLGWLLDEREQVSWLIGFPVGLGLVIYVAILRRRRQNAGNGS